MVLLVILLTYQTKGGDINQKETFDHSGDSIIISSIGFMF